MSSLPCRVCAHETRRLFEGPLLKRTVSYHECAQCGYVQTEEPTWLAEAYAQAINLSDTGIMARNERNARLVLRTVALLGLWRGRVIDFAGGYGLLVRMLRDRGIDAWWQDSYATNLVARGFEAAPGEKADLVTAFEAFEHFVKPGEELERLAREAGVEVLHLETNGSLHAAIQLYRSAGFEEVAAFNEEPYAHHWFEKRLG